MRVRFATERDVSLSRCARSSPAVEPFDMDWDLHDTSAPVRAVVVSKQGHVLHNLLFSARGSAADEIAAVVSNHRAGDVVQWRHGIDFHHPRPRPAESGASSQDLMERTGAEVLILARYMQISATTCRRVRGRAINIHHSLPASRVHALRASPQHSVKVIGATTASPPTRRGPIIKQDFVRSTTVVPFETRHGSDLEARPRAGGAAHAGTVSHLTA